MLAPELTPKSGPSRSTQRTRAASLVAAHEELLLLLTTLRGASAHALVTLYFGQPPRGLSRRSAYRVLSAMCDVGLLATQRLLGARSVFRLRGKALRLSARVAARSTEAPRKPIPSHEAEYCWLRASIWAALTDEGYRVGRGRDELMALRRFLVDEQTAAVKKAGAVEREAATLALEGLRKSVALTPMFRSRCRSCGTVGPLNKALSACPRCKGNVDHVLSELRFTCARCGLTSDAPQADAHESVTQPGKRCPGLLREVDHLPYDVAWRVVDGRREVMLVLVDDPGRSVAAQLEELPLRIVGQPRLPILLRTTDTSSTFSLRDKGWATRGDRHRELLRAFSDAPGRAAFPFRTTAHVVDIRPELQLRFTPRRKEPSHA